MKCKTCQLRNNCMYAFDLASVYCPDSDNYQEPGRNINNIRHASNVRKTV